MSPHQLGCSLGQAVASAVASLGLLLGGSVTPLLAQTADLAVSKVGAPEPVGAGSNLTYSVTVTNAGPDGAAAVTLTDVLPSQTTFVSGSAGCTEAAGVVTCAVGSLAANASATVTIVVSSTICSGTVTNQAVVLGAETDPNLLDNTNATVNTVMDLTPPVIGACPANITGDTDLGACTKANVTWTDPTAIDNCPGVTVACLPASGSTFPKGVTVVTCTATDGADLTNACTFSVTITDTEAPVLGACPANITGTTDPATCTKANVTWTDPTATDNCAPAPTVACDPVSGSTFPKGVSVVTCTATDAAGNTNACTFTVTISDTEPPSITCPANITGDTDLGACTKANVTWADPAAADNCPGIVAACSPSSGSTFPKGVTVVTCTATDAAGNTNACTFTVTINDAEPPVLGACPTDITGTTDPAACTKANVTWTDPTATDNCAPAPTVACVPASGSTFAKGVSVVTCTATDAAGNTNACTFTVTISDTEPPSFTCPANIVGDTDPGQCSKQNVSWTASASDNCPGVSVTCTPPSGSTFAKGATSVDCAAVDTSGNTNACTFTVTINDAEPPSLTCPNIVDIVDAGQCSKSNVTWSVGSDNCPGVTTSCTPPSGSTFATGVSTVNCTATDTSGNSNACSFTVTISDTENPTITCPANILTTTEPGTCHRSNVTWPAPSATDNCAVTNVSCVPPSGSTFPGGTTTVTCTAMDDSGNSAQCAFSVTVEDNQDPVLTCPANRVVECAGPPGTPVTFAATATDNCSSPQDIFIFCSKNSGDLFPLGTTTVFCVAFDESGNADICHFTVTVHDTTPPGITCPANLVAGTDVGQCSKSNVTWVASATDVCDAAPTVVCSPASGSTFAKGTTAVTCTATDGSGNTNACTFTVTINDTEKPSITCPANITDVADAGQCSKSNVAWTVTTSDNCPGETSACTPPSGSTFAQGVTTVTCVATDASGNTNTCTFTVTINDTENPTITCPANITTNSPGNCEALVNYAPPTATDNCPGVTSACVPASGSTFAVGATTVSCTATDASGNLASCSFTVTVNVSAPTITTQPQNQTTPMGNGAVFSVTASGTPPLSYQWQSNGVDVAGATASSLAVSNMTLVNNGDQYQSIVSNCAGVVTSQVATLTVTPIAGVSFDFNTPLQFTNAPYYMVFNDWLNSSFNTPVTVFESPIGGVGPFPGSGCLDLIPNNGTVNSSILLPLSYDFSLPGKTLTASAMVKIKNPVSNNRNTQIGFCTSTNADLDNSAGRAYMTVLLQSTAQPAPTYELRQGTKPMGANTFIEGNAAAAGTLTVSNWYRVKATFVNNTATTPSTYRLTATVENLGPDGSASPVVVATINNITLTNADVVSARNLYFVVRGIENTGVEYRDNFHVSSVAGPVAFVQPPGSQTVLHGRRAIFKALVDGDGPYTYQWYKDGSPITGARSWKYITPPATTSDNGAQYTVEVTGPGNTVTSAPATLTVTPDALAVVGAGSVDGATVGVEFNQPVDVATAENPSNYLINGVTPLQARVYRTGLGPMGLDGVYVILTPASILNAAFALTVSGVNDLSGNLIGGANSASGYFANLTGANVNPLVTGPPGENQCFGPGKFIITGGGADIWTTADQTRYVYTRKTGDFDVRARIPYLDVVRSPSKAGFLVRASLDPFSPMALAAVNPMWPGRNFPEGTTRSGYNTAAFAWGANPTYNLSWYPNAWLRMRRAGNTFIRYSSTNGVDWQCDGQISLTIPQTAYLGLAVCAVANLNACSAQFENVGDFAGYSGATIVINSQPTNMTVSAGNSTNNGVIATVSGGGIPANGELSYVWQRNDGSGNWTNLPTAGATNNTITIGPLWGADNGAQFRVVLKAPGAADVISDTFAATVPDTTPPTLSSVNSAIMPSYPVSEVVLNFSENVDPASASTAGNYNVTNAAGVALSVLSASFLGNDPKVIVLKVDGTLGLGNSSVSVSGVKDLNNNTIAPVVRTFRSFIANTAPVVHEVYQDIGNATDIATFIARAEYTSGKPTYITYSNLFGYNVSPSGTSFANSQDNYGVKSYTYFVPSASGAVKFWIRSDDAGQLWMNTNAVNSTDPAGKVLICENTGANFSYSVGTTPANSKTNIALVAGQAYYMEFLLKEGGGGDGFSVATTAPTVNTAPGITTYIPTANLAYPVSAASSTPVVMELYTGYQNFLAGFNQLPGLYAATNLPTDNYAISTVNYKYIAGVPDIIGYQKYFGVQPTTLGNTRFDNYLGRILTYFVAPSNGLYKFWMGVDDIAQLWMNTNAVNSTDPAGKVLLGQSAIAFATTASQLIAQNVPLVGGQKYYLEALWREGGGGDGVRIAVRAQSDYNIPPTSEVIPASMLENPTGLCRGGAVNLTGIVPSLNRIPWDGSTTVQVGEGESLTLTAAGVRGAPSLGAFPWYGFLWFKNGVRVFENTITNVTQPFTMADDGAVYTLTVTNGFSSVSRSITIDVVPDSTPPVPVRAVAWRYGDGFTLEFNELLDPPSAANLANYSVSGLQLVSATLDPTRKMVSIRTSPQVGGATYTVAINGVKDAAGNAANTTTTFCAWVVGGSGFLVELYTNIVGSTIADLTGTPKFAANLPDVVYYTNVFGVGSFGANSLLENYGARITGYFVPTNTGLYRFYARSDDASQFWMTINSADPENPAGRVMLIHQPNANVTVQDPRAISPPVPLVQGLHYFCELLMKEGTGGDYALVTFRNTDANGTAVGAVIPPADTVAELQRADGGSFDGAPGNPNLITICGTPPEEKSVKEAETVELALCLTVPRDLRSVASFQWEKFDGAAYTNIPGAKGPKLTFIARLADDGALYRLRASMPGLTKNYVTLLHVTLDDLGPTLVSAGSVDGLTVAVYYDKAVDPITATDSANYVINGGVQSPVGTPVLLADQRTVIMALDSLITSDTFTVDAFSIYSQAASPVPNDSSISGHVEFLTPLDVGVPGTIGVGGYNAAMPGFSISVTNDSIDVSANGWDIWNAADGFHYTYRPVLGNFDVKVRVEDLVGADQWSKAGWMARPALTNTSRFLLMAVTPTVSPIFGQNPVNSYSFQWRARDTDGVNSGNTLADVTLGVAPPYPNAWLRLQRIGSVFNGYISTNGQDWALYNSRDTAANLGGPMPELIYLGLATVSHDQTRGLANNALAKYRNLDFPLPPNIDTQPGPTPQVVGIHQTVTLSGLGASGVGPIAYQWRKNGVAIPGATETSLTLTDTKASDSGLYTVLVANNGGGTLSIPLVLIVTNELVIVGETNNLVQNVGTNIVVGDLLANDSDPDAGLGDALAVLAVSGVYPVTVETNFNEGLLSGANIYGTAAFLPTDGDGGSGGLLLTPGAPATSQAGSLVLGELTPGKRVSTFMASFKLRISNASGEPADGFSFNFAGDLQDTANTGLGENGVGSGISFCVDNYRFAPYPPGGLANTSGMKIRYRGLDVTGVQTPTWNANRYVPVTIALTPEGALTVTVDGTNVFGTITLAGYAPAAGRFGLYARTGGQAQAHAIDDLSITVLTLDTARGSGPGPAPYGAAYIDGGVLHLTDSVINQLGSYLTGDLAPGQAVTSFTASFKIRVADGSGNPADGFSLSFANDLPTGVIAGGEEGGGTGLIVAFDNYDNGGGEAPAIEVKWAGAVVPNGHVSIPKIQSPNYQNVLIKLDPDGTVDVQFAGTNVFTDLPTPYAPITGGRFGLAARTGGERETHWVDDLAISVTTASGSASYTSDFSVVPHRFGTVTLAGGVVTYIPPDNACGSDSFYYLVTDGQQAVWDQKVVQIDEANPEPPTISRCASDITLVADATCQALVPDFTSSVQAADNCCCFTITQSPVAGTSVGLGPHTVTITVTDTMGLTATCTATLTVVDATAPTIACPSPQTLYGNPHNGNRAAIPDLLTGLVVSDNCSTPTLAQNPAAGALVGGGLHNVEVTAIDGAGNAATCTVAITVIEVSLYAQTILSQGPIAYYRFNDAVTTPVFDTATNRGSLGAAANGFYNLAAHPVPGALVGSSDTAVRPDGTGRSVQIPYTAALNPAAPFSVEAWFKPAAVNAAGTLTCAISSGHLASPRSGWLIYQSDTGWNLRFYNQNGTSTSLNITGGGAPNTNTWYHVVVVYDGTTVTQYVNGVVAAFGTPTGFVPNTDGVFSLGTRSDNSFNWAGSADEVALYNTALSAARVAAHYGNGTDPAPATPYDQVVLADSPLLYLRLDEAAFVPPVALNSGSLGAVANGGYYGGAIDGSQAPPYPQFVGFESSNTAVQLDGVNDFVGTLISLMNNRPVFTLSGWIRRNGAQPNRTGLWGQNDLVEFGYIDDNTIQAWTDNALNVSPNPIPNGEWAHLAVVSDGPTISIYTNGLFAASRAHSLPGGGVSAFNFNIGGGGIFDGAGNFFNGQIDEVAVFDKALSPVGIASQYVSAVPVAPQIVVNLPANTNIYLGDTLTLPLGAVGTPTLRYQWFFFGTEIPGQTNASLVLANVDDTASGTYYCEVSNDYGGPVQSSWCDVLVLNEAPTIVQQPAPVTVYAGFTARFTVVAFGGQHMTFQWLKAATPIPGATNATLVLSPVQTGDAAAYKVVVSNPAGSVESASATLTVLVAPAGTFEAKVVGQAPIAYWNLEETAGPTAHDYVGLHDATAMGGLTFGTVGPRPPTYPGMAADNKAVELNGTDAFLTVTPSMVNGLPAFTMMGWINLAAAPGARVALWGQNDALEFGWHDAGQIGIWSPTGGFIETPYPFALDQWYFVAATGNGTTLTLYVNSVAVLSGGNATASYGSSSFPFNIGAAVLDASGNYFNGRIEDVAVFNRALSADEICQTYAAAVGHTTRITMEHRAILDSKPTGTPYDGLDFGAAWLASSTDGASVTRAGVMEFVALEGDQITLAANPAFNSPQGTIAFWMRSAGTAGGGNYGAILFDRRTSSGDVIVQQDDGKIFVQAQDNGGANSFSTVGTVGNDRWHHVAYVYDQSAGGSIAIYLDGVLDTSQNNSKAWSWPASQQVELGRSHDSFWRLYNGQLDDFRIYSRVLTAGEIGQISSSGALVDTAALQVRFNFDTLPGFALSWPLPCGVLQTTDALQGNGAPTIWVDLPGAKSPYVIRTTDPARFFRVRNPSP